MSEAQTETPQSHLEVGDESQHSTPHSLGEKQYSGFETDRTDKEAGGDGDNPFDIELTQEEKKKLIVEDPNRVNVDQFYPELEHQFMKSNSKFIDDQGHQAEKAIKEFVDEDSSLKSIEDSKNGSAHMQLVPKDTPDPDTPLWSKEDENNSSDPQLAYYMARWQLSREEEDRQSRKSQRTGGNSNGDEGVFGTEVDEESLEQAKARQQKKKGSLFQPESWGMEKPYQPSMSEIMAETAEKHLNKAMELKEAGDHQGVILWINKAMGIKGEDMRYYIERAEAYIKLCDFQSAILNYKKACLLEPANEQFYNRLSFLYYFHGQSLFDQRLYPEALEAFSRAAEMQPDNVGYHIRSITCLAALQRHGECLALVNKRLETETDNPDLYVMRARLHEMFRNTTLCYYDVKDALGLNSEHPEAMVMMEKLQKIAQENKKQAMHMNLVGKHRDALQKISIAIETDPSVADFHVLRGALHRKLGDYNAAIDDFLLALDKCNHDEDSPVYTDSQRQLLLTYNDFAVECFTKGFYEEAIILLNKAIKGEKREKGLYVNRGDCFFRQEEYNFALQDYHQGLELDPHDETIKSRISVIHNEFGVSAYQEKMYTEAEVKFTEAIEYHPKVGQYYISRSRARHMLENMSGARGDLIMGLLLDPTNEDVISILSRLFPGKSVGDVLNSRAAEAAKYAIKNIFSPPKPASVKDDEDQSVLSEEEAGSQEGAVACSQSDVQSEVSERSSSFTEEAVWKPDSCLPAFKSMMEEQDLNIKLVTVKQDINSKVKVALQDRKSLKYDGPRLKPLPPPAPKPSYGGMGFRKEKLITAPGKQKSTGWKQFSMGIGLADN